MRPAPRPRSLRREAPVLLPLALALFVLLAGVTLAFYRAGVARLASERGAEALALAERLVEEGGRPTAARLDAWRRRLPPGAALALVDADGRPLASAGAIVDTLDPELVAEALADGHAIADPARLASPRVAVLLRLPAAADPMLLRLELPATALAAEQRTLGLLTPLVVGLAIATALVVVLFFRALLRPYETMLARAQAAAGGDGDAGEDELAFLVATFDRALAAIGTPRGDLEPLADTLGRSLDGGFLLVDPERRVLVATPAAAELLGHPAPAAGTPLASAFPAEPELGAALESALAEPGGSAFRTVRLATADGERAVGVTAEPLRGVGGRPRGWLVVVGDRTESERSAARERLADGLAQLGELSAGVAHELRNGLAALGGWLDLARRRANPPETVQCLDEMARESAALARVVDEFLAFARPGTGRLESCDLVAIARRAAADPAFDPPGARLVAAPAVAPFVGDPALLERALRNLIANAAAAHRDADVAAPVEITVERSDDGWRLAVDDRGRGVPEPLRAGLFEPFVSGRPGGVGLGLALARRIAVLHRGDVRFTPRPGGGSRFTLAMADAGQPADDTIVT